MTLQQHNTTINKCTAAEYNSTQHIFVFFFNLIHAVKVVPHFRSCIFRPWTFSTAFSYSGNLVPHFPVLHFQSTRVTHSCAHYCKLVTCKCSVNDLVDHWCIKFLYKSFIHQTSGSKEKKNIHIHTVKSN